MSVFIEAVKEGRDGKRSKWREDPKLLQGRQGGISDHLSGDEIKQAPCEREGGI